MNKESLRKLVKEELSKALNESPSEYQVGDIVIPNKGPHKGEQHKIIFVNPKEKRYTIKPVGLPASKIKYRLGAVTAYAEDLGPASKFNMVGLNEGSPKYKKGDTLTYMGTKHEVVSDDGFVVKAKLPNGKIKTYNHSQLKETLNESPYPLIPKKMLLADILEINDIPDEEFAPQTKKAAADFIRKGRPSETYLEGILSVLQDYGVDTSKVEDGPTMSPKQSSTFSGDINPYDILGTPTKGRMGGTYRGD